MIKISLNKVKIFGYHGLHQEEKITGAEFEVSMDVFFHVSKRLTHLHDTIDYTVLYNIVKERMNEPAELLETIVQDISDRVRETFPHTKQINITISKIHPPLANFRGQFSVSLTNDI